MGDKIDKIRGTASSGLQTTKKGLSPRGSPQRGHMGLSMQGCHGVRVQVFQHLDATDLLQHLKGNPRLNSQAFPLRPSGVPTLFRLF